MGDRYSLFAEGRYQGEASGDLEGERASRTAHNGRLGIVAQVRFDDSLPILVATMTSALGAEALRSSVVLRDASGRLTVFCAANIGEESVRLVNDRLRGALGAYAGSDVAAVSAQSPGAEGVFEDSAARILSVDGHAIRFVDRRLIGADWLRVPVDLAGPPARFVFSSLKGGVGRSTALCVAAAHLASQGRRVLAIDLDLEAPGLDVLLLNDGTLPSFGVVDALVENGLGGIDEEFIADLRGPSSLAPAGGRIDVVPAFGLRSRRKPADALAKLARAYSEDVNSDGSIATLLDQVGTLVDRVATSERYDAVLIDSRAGLHEASAAAIIGLGAEVFLFGRDEAQTFHGYSFLLAHLSRLLVSSDPTPEWLERFTPVQALAPIDAMARLGFRDQWEEMVRETGLLPQPEDAAGIPLPEGFSDVPWRDDELSEDDLAQEASLLQPIAVLRSADYDAFDPQRRQDLLSRSVYETIFGALLARLDEATMRSVEDS